MTQAYTELRYDASKTKIWCPLKGEYHKATPEEIVRQEYILHLHTRYGYALVQMAQERKTQSGRRSARADIVIWESVAAKAAEKSPVIVVECKSDNVTIVESDYFQGEFYARSVGCELFVTHNNKETRFFKLVPGLPGEWVDIEDIPQAGDWGDAKKIEAIKRATRAFNCEEFRRLLFECHSILRDVHKMEPGRAFDEISKILFIKMFIERTGNWGKFTAEFLDQREQSRLPIEAPVMDALFDSTKKYYSADEIFPKDDKLEISESTFRRIVKKLERFNLSTFEQQRDDLHAEYDPRIDCYDNPGLGAILEELALLGVRRNGNRWETLPDLPQETQKKVSELQRRFNTSITSADRERRKALHKELSERLKHIDQAHQEALWVRVKQIFDYPIFFAEPEVVGITSTGAEGPNELPEMAAQYRQFEAWLKAGANPAALPNFP